MDEMKLEKCLHILQTSKSDNEKIAALLLVTKLVKAENSDEESRRCIFESIGFKFLERLLKSTSVPDACHENAYKAIAVSVLACFATDSEMAKHPQMISKLPFFNEIILSNPSETENNEDIALVDDCYQCLQSISLTDEGKKGFTQHQTNNALCRAFIEQSYGHERAIQLILSLCQQGRTDMWTHNTRGLVSLLRHIGSLFHRSQDETKFKHCKNLITVLMSTYKVQLESTASDWSEDIYRTLFIMLKSKLGVAQRMDVLKLACVLVDGCGVECTLEGGRDKKLLLLIVHLICIEVRMALEDHSMEQVLSKADMICHGYNLLENVISYLTTCPSLGLEEKQVGQLHAAMVGAFSAIIFFLNIVAQEHPNMTCAPIVCASVRALGSWLAEETTALQDSVLEILPFIIKVCKVSFERQTGENVHTTDPDEAAMITEAAESHDPGVEVLQFLLPGLCHLSSDDRPRCILVQHGAHQLLGSYFTYHWKNFCDNSVSESEVAMTTMCGIFMNFVVMEPSMIEHDQMFQELLQFIMKNLPGFDSGGEHIVLQMNLCVLGLMLLRHQSTVISDNEVECKKFCGSVISLLSHAHISETRKKGRKVLVVTDVYKQEWMACIKELWLLGMQAFGECIPLLSWIPTTVLETGWLPMVTKILLDVKADSVEAEVRQAYQCLLREMCNASPQAKQVLNEKEAGKVARLYNMDELFKCLS